MLEIQISGRKSIEELPSPGGRGWEIGRCHPHPHPLPSREREMFFRFEHLDFGFVSSFDIRISDFQNRRF